MALFCIFVGKIRHFKDPFSKDEPDTWYKSEKNSGDDARGFWSRSEGILLKYDLKQNLSIFTLFAKENLNLDKY